MWVWVTLFSRAVKWDGPKVWREKSGGTVPRWSHPKNVFQPIPSHWPRSSSHPKVKKKIVPIPFHSFFFWPHPVPSHSQKTSSHPIPFAKTLSHPIDKNFSSHPNVKNFSPHPIPTFEVTPFFGVENHLLENGFFQVCLLGSNACMRCVSAKRKKRGLHSETCRTYVGPQKENFLFFLYTGAPPPKKKGRGSDTCRLVQLDPPKKGGSKKFSCVHTLSPLPKKRGDFEA